MENRVDFLLEIAAFVIEIGDSIIGSLCQALQDDFLRLVVA